MNTGSGKPLISVVIPVYNGEKFVAQAIDSVLGQTYKNTEIIIVNDASTDATAEIIGSYTDERIRIISFDENRQVCASRNAGIKAATGEYLAQLDADDIWLPEKLEKQLACLQAHPEAGVCFTWSRIIDENGLERKSGENEDILWLYDAFHQQNRSQSEWLMRFLTKGNCFNVDQSLMRMGLVRKIGLQNVSLLQSQDFEYWIRAASTSQIVVICEELVLYRRVRDNNTSLSAVSSEMRTRSNNEEVYVCYHFFDNMTDETFAELFRPYFRRSDATGHEELLCEKAFLLKKAFCVDEPYLASMQRLLEEQETADILKTKYNYTPKDFYKENKEHRYFDGDVRRALADGREQLDDALRRHTEESELRREAQRLSEELKKEKAEIQLLAEKAASEEREARRQAELADKAKKQAEIEQELADKEKKQAEFERELADERCRVAMEQLQVEQNQSRAEAREAAEERRRLDEAYQQANAELYAMKASRTWRITAKLRSVLRFLVPIGSKRALFIRLVWTMLSHPLVFFRSLKKTKFGKFFSLLRQGKIADIGYLIRYNISPEKFPLPAYMLENEPPQPQPKKEKTAEDYVALTLPDTGEPLVSIIIPVYNHFDYTYNCAASIIHNTHGVSYEIILADDNSTDVTIDAESVLCNVKVARNEKNLGFLLNCNNAAKSARGKYILLLNNDTCVQDDWLRPLVELIERRDDIGMVGSKLVYPDGTLQEAGGILWSDGSAWNYGNGQDPERPEYNYVKEVDYISGASIMIKRVLWEEIGGFDESFVPAYYEDTDLAFEVRRHGYKVMYQPLSVVVHYEGKSNGTDTGSGMKRYQVINAQKFYDKWKDVLQAEHTPNGVNVFQSRDRSRGRKTLFMADHYVPTFDKDAGSRCVFQYIQLFVSEGFAVKFVGDNFYPTQPYTQVLQQMGVEVLVGNYYAQNWKKWLEENGEYIGYAFLNRPHIAPNYIDLLRQYTRARIAYFGHDLHFLREMREYEITGDPALLESSNTWRAKELSIMRKMDVAYYPSIVEENMVHSIDPSINVKAIPLNIFDDVDEQPFEPEKRTDVVFIGGFSHRPNVDAVKWLADEIMPELLKLVPDIKVHVLGSNAPEELLKLSNEHMIMEGYVTDETLAWFYKRSRVTIAPLRYGAGIKGKVVEAMHSGMPMVTTSIGAEGLTGAENILVIEDDAKEFARKLAQLYQSPEMLEERSKASYQYIRDTFSRKNAIRIIGSDFDIQA